MESYGYIHPLLYLKYGRCMDFEQTFTHPKFILSFKFMEKISKNIQKYPKKNIQNHVSLMRFPKMGGTPKSSILIGFSIKNHLQGTPMTQEIPIYHQQQKNTQAMMSPQRLKRHAVRRRLLPASLGMRFEFSIPSFTIDGINHSRNRRSIVVLSSLLSTLHIIYIYI